MTSLDSLQMQMTTTPLMPYTGLGTGSQKEETSSFAAINAISSLIPTGAGVII